MGSTSGLPLPVPLGLQGLELQKCGPPHAESHRVLFFAGREQLSLSTTPVFQQSSIYRLCVRSHGRFTLVSNLGQDKKGDSTFALLCV